MTAVKAGDVVWNITGETKGLQAGLKTSGKLVTAFGAATVAALGLSIKAFASAGDEIQKMSLRTGISVESLSELKVAAELSGSSLEAVEKGVKRMAKFLNDANVEMVNTAGAGGRMADILGQVGLKLSDLKNLSPEETFNKLSLAIAEVPDPLTRAAVAQEIFGRAGTELLPMLSQGAAGLEAMRQKAHELGVVFDQEAADSAAGFQDAMLELGLSFDSIKFAIAKNIIPILVDEVIPAIINTIQVVREWMEANPGLTGTIIKVGAAVGAISLVVGPLLIVLPGLVSAFGVLTGAAGILSGAAGLGGVAAASTGLIATLAGPLGLAAAVGVAAFAVKSAITSFGDMRQAQDLAKDATVRFTETDRALKESLVARGIITQEVADKLKNHNEIMDVAQNRQRETKDTTEELVAKYGDWVNRLDDTSKALLAEKGAVGGVGQSYDILTGQTTSLIGETDKVTEAFKTTNEAIKTDIEHLALLVDQGRATADQITLLQQATGGMSVEFDKSLSPIQADIQYLERLKEQSRATEGQLKLLGDAIRNLPSIPNLRGGPGIPGMAKGGISPGGMTLVGEGTVKGELVNLRPGAQVFTAAQSSRMMGTPKVTAVQSQANFENEIRRLTLQITREAMTGGTAKEDLSALLAGGSEAFRRGSLLERYEQSRGGSLSERYEQKQLERYEQSRGGGAAPVININMGGVTVACEQDADSLANKVAQSIKREFIGLGYAT